MAHQVRLFAGTELALARIAALLPGVVAYALMPAPQLLVLPLDDDALDVLHRENGTGEWLETGPRLTTTDLETARRASAGTVLAYLETDYFGGTGMQSAILWRDAVLAVGPLAMLEGPRRPPGLRPVNAVLRAYGVLAQRGLDEFDTIGLGLWRSNEAIQAGAQPLPLHARYVR